MILHYVIIAGRSLSPRAGSTTCPGALEARQLARAARIIPAKIIPTKIIPAKIIPAKIIPAKNFPPNIIPTGSTYAQSPC